jgi:GNAT superfamily N-acetyltransferase
MPTPAFDITVRAVDSDHLDDLDTLFASSKTTAGCRCMWFIASAKECQAGWGEPNRSAFAALTENSPDPVGLLAYRGEEPVGWCAAGPRSRYARALRSPHLKERDAWADGRSASSRAGEDDTVWLVPCFYVRRDARKVGVTASLLRGAVDLARSRGATAVEGFPLAGDGRRGAAEAYLGVEPLFAACGFTAVARPSPNRVIMRHPL